MYKNICTLHEVTCIVIKVQIFQWRPFMNSIRMFLSFLMALLSYLYVRLKTTYNIT